VRRGRESLEFVFLQQFVIADQTEAITGAGGATTLNHHLNSPLRLRLESARVVTKIFFVFPEHAWREPQFADRDLAEQALKPQDMIQVWMRKDKGGQVGLAIYSREMLDQLINYRRVIITVIVTKTQVTDINLHHSLVVDDDCCAIASTDGPKQESSL
jgi:hypothetical protein